MGYNLRSKDFRSDIGPTLSCLLNQQYLLDFNQNKISYPSSYVLSDTRKKQFEVYLPQTPSLLRPPSHIGSVEVHRPFLTPEIKLTKLNSR